MTKQERAKYLDKKPVAVYPMSNHGGIEILDIENGYYDYAIVRYNLGRPENMHKVRIRHNAHHRSFFIIYDMRIYLDECMRVDI